MGLTLDEPTESDAIYQNEDFILLGDERLKDSLADLGGLRIDFVQDPWRGTGFSITFRHPAAGNCSC